MSRKNSVEELEYGPANGLDTTTELPQMSPGFVREARNCNLGFNTGWQKRDGYQDQGVSWTAYTNFSVLQGTHYTNSTGADHELIFAVNDINDARLGKKVGTAITDLQTGLSSTRRLHFTQFDDRVFAFNGDATNVPLTYEGSAVRGFGIIKPAAEPGTAETTGGSLTLLAQYGYVYKYIRRISGNLLASSSPSPLVQITLTGANNQVDLTLVASTEAWVTNIQIYRTVADGNQLFLEAEIGNVTAHSSIVSDSSLTDTLETDDSRFQDFSSALDYPITAQQRVFLKIGPNKGRFSKIGQEGPLPESSEVEAFYSTLGINGTRDDIIGHAKVNDTILVLKERSIGRLDPVGTPPTGSSFDNVGYTYRELDSAVGALSHDGGREVFGEYVFLGRENVYAVNGVIVRPVANQIQETIKGFFYKQDNIAKISAINDVNNKQIKFSAYKSVVSNVPDIVIIGDYKQYPSFRWTTYEPGLDASTHPGYRVGSFWEKENPATGRTEYFFGNTDENGKIYQVDKGTDDDGDPIFFKIITRPYDMQRPMNYKLFKKAEILAQTTNPDKLLTFCSIFDMDDTEEFCTDFILPAIGGEWADDAETLGDYWDDEGGAPSDLLLYADYEDSNFTPEFSAGGTTFTLGGSTTPSIVTKNGSKQVFIPDVNGSSFEYDDPALDGGDIGSIKWKLTFDYAGTPSTDRDLLAIGSSVSTHPIFLRHKTSSGDLVAIITTSTGTHTFTVLSGFSPSINDVVEYHLGWNTAATPSGLLYVHIDGVLQNSSAPYTYTTSNRSSNNPVGFGRKGVLGGSKFYIDEPSSWSTIQHTGDYTPPTTNIVIPGVIPAGEKILVWAGQPLERLGFYFHKKAKFVQFVFSQIETDAPVEMIGWGVEGSIFGQFSVT